MKAKGKKYWGTILDYNTINNAAVTNIIKNEFGQLTCENSMKMDTVQPQQGTFNFNVADQVVRFAEQNGMLMRGHTFIWHGQLPGWVNSINNRNTLTTAIQTHINTVMARYKGRIYGWDVVNEVLNEDGSMRSSVYSNVMQEDFIGVGFRAAKAADPAAVLYINDYNLDTPSYSKVNGMVDKVKKWKAAGVPIDAIGSQSHLSAGLGAQAQATLQKLATAGVKEVAMTELDITGAGTTDYANVAKACLNVPQCVGITSWGIRDSESWRSGNSPLMFDGSGNKKPAYYAAYDALA